MEILEDKNIQTQEIAVKEKNIVNDKKTVYKAIKRVFDIVFSLIGMVLLSPVFFIIAVIIKLDSKGPVFFVHSRIGEKGKPIGIYKFRTMVNNAEDLIKSFTPEQKEEFERSYKLEDDPRITKVGDFLRKTSLDELPQILNILKGELSIIGPRPIVENELEKYGDNKDKFLSVKPGLTGYWQVNGRSNINYEERMNLELYYVDNQSLLLDVKIFFKTFGTVLKHEGAN